MDDQKFVDMLLKEMFKRVGEKYPNKELTDDKEWYRLRSWTSAEEKRFGDWMIKKMKKQWKYINTRRIEFEADMFLMMWGWKTEDKVNG